MGYKISCFNFFFEKMNSESKRTDETLKFVWILLKLEENSMTSEIFVRHIRSNIFKF